MVNPESSSAMILGREFMLLSLFDPAPIPAFSLFRMLMHQNVHDGLDQIV